MAETIDSLSYRKRVVFLMENIFIVPAMQHGRRVKPLLTPYIEVWFGRCMQSTLERLLVLGSQHHP